MGRVPGAGRRPLRRTAVVALALWAAIVAAAPAAASECAECAEDAVRVGDVCVDKYEASVWSTPPGVLPETQYGVSEGDYPCAASGQNCGGVIFARSQASAKPAIAISWFQAVAACANVGKRLLTNAEWQMAAAGTPDSGAADDHSTDCNTNTLSGPVATGSRSKCESTFGAFDMVGNVWEWVADWVPQSGPCPGWGDFSDDAMCLSGARTLGVEGPGALYRGGNFGTGTAAGVFSISGQNEPQFPSDTIGFRCGR